MDKPDSILVGETLLVHTRAINRDGDSIPGAVITLFSRNPDTLAVDAAGTSIIGKVKGTGRLVAVSNGLPSDVIQIPVK